jgi:hypothetical protein
MSGHDAESTSVLDAVKGGFDDVTMSTPVGQIMAAGRARRRRRRLVRATGVAAVVGLVVGVAAHGDLTTGRAQVSLAGGAQSAQIQTAAYTVAAQPNGNVTVTWTKQGYFQDPAGLQAALRNAGLPVLIKVGEFCKGPSDDGYLDPSGSGRGLDQVMQPSRSADGSVVFTFVPSALPAGTELFIGYLSPSQLAVTQGRPGSVERLVPTDAPLACTTQAPPAAPPRPAPAQGASANSRLP